MVANNLVRSVAELPASKASQILTAILPSFSDLKLEPESFEACCGAIFMLGLGPNMRLVVAGL
jgi:hypothetical protein